MTVSCFWVNKIQVHEDWGKWVSYVETERAERMSKYVSCVIREKIKDCNQKKAVLYFTVFLEYNNTLTRV